MADVTEPSPQEVLTVLNCDGFTAALELIDRLPGSRLQRHVSAVFAKEVLPLFESKHPDDPRPRRAIESALNDNATLEERAAACADSWAARDAAAEAAEWTEWAAASAASAYMACSAARGVELAVAYDAVKAAQKAQEETLRKMLTEMF